MIPLIGISCDVAPERPGRPELPDAQFDYLKSAYSEYIARCGGAPVALPNLKEPNTKLLAQIASRIDGLLLSGGADVSPALYGDESAHPKTKCQPLRDSFELALLRFFLANTEKPVLGICRGHQLLNVAFGGTLWQDVSQFWNTDPPVILEHRAQRGKDGILRRLWHYVVIAEDSMLREILGTERLLVNSSHHQLVRDLGLGLRCVGRAPDGVCEALEATEGGRFVLSVQWHPEAADDEYSKRLFSAFVDAAMRAR